MQLVAITDIFGKTSHFQKIIDHISTRYETIEIIDPYEGADKQFQNEEEAYKQFQETMGLENYSRMLLQNLQRKKADKQIVVLGFSIGASAIWAISEELKPPGKIRAICFYSSQIRHYLDVTPQIAIDLYFAKNEPGYDVETMIERIAKKPNVKCYKTPYLHGFMNKLSKNYNQDGYNNYLKIINNA